MARSLLTALIVLVSSAPWSSAILAEEAQAIRNVPRITIDELKVLMTKNAVLLIDVRDRDSFAKGRIPGAVNVDYTRVLAEADRFKGKREPSSRIVRARAK